MKIGGPACPEDMAETWAKAIPGGRADALYLWAPPFQGLPPGMTAEGPLPNKGGIYATYGQRRWLSIPFDSGDANFPGVWYVIYVARMLGAEWLAMGQGVRGLSETGGEPVCGAVTDHINLLGTSPLLHPAARRFGNVFVDLATVYDAKAIDALEAGCAGAGVKCCRGVLLGSHQNGHRAAPFFKGHARARFQSERGVLESIAAAHAGMKVLSTAVTDIEATPRALEGIIWDAASAPV